MPASCGAWNARAFASTWPSLVSGGSRLVEERGLSTRLSTVPGKRRVSSYLGEALESLAAC